MDFTFITINIFLETLLEWVGEFYIISSLIFFRFEKNKRFPLLFIGGLLILVALAYPLSIFYYFYGGTILGRSFVYLTLFALAVVHHLFCYKMETLRKILFCDLAYLTQNCIYKLFLIINSTLRFFDVYGPYGPSVLGYKILYYSNFVVFVILSYFLYIRKINKYIGKLLIPNFTILISLFTILISNFLCSMFDIHFEQFIKDIEPVYNDHLIFVTLASDLLTTLLDISIIVMFFAYMRRINLDENIAQMKYIIAQSEEQYKISQDTIESINIKCHDMRHKVNQIVGDNLSQETLKEVTDVINIYDSLIDTGNKTLDVILREKQLICDKYEISFTRLVTGKAVSFLSEGDLFCLFGNILDNAIDATKNLEKKSKRYINLVVKGVGEGIAHIECQNYFYSEIEFEDNLPKTRNQDKNSHGFGMKSIQNIVNKYGGSLSISTNKHLFTLKIVVYNNVPNK